MCVCVCVLIYVWVIVVLHCAKLKLSSFHLLYLLQILVLHYATREE